MEVESSRVTRLGGQPACSYKLLFFQPYVYMIGGVTRQPNIYIYSCSRLQILKTREIFGQIHLPNIQPLRDLKVESDNNIQA